MKRAEKVEQARIAIYAKARAHGLTQYEAILMTGARATKASAYGMGSRFERRPGVREAIEAERARIAANMDSHADATVAYLGALARGETKGTNQDRIAAGGLILKAAGRMIDRKEIRIGSIPYASLVGGEVMDAEARPVAGPSAPVDAAKALPDSSRAAPALPAASSASAPPVMGGWAVVAQVVEGSGVSVVPGRGDAGRAGGDGAVGGDVPRG